MESPVFLEYKAEDHAKARETKYVADLLAWVEWEIAQGRAACVDMVAANKTHAATVLSGGIATFEQILLKVHAPDPEPEKEQERFIDPAMPEGETA